MSELFVLFEHAAGFALFKVQEFEEIGSLLPQVESSVTDWARFSSIVRLSAHSTFETSVDALDAINCISEGVVPQNLQIFLESQFPKVAKRQKYLLGVGESKLGANISELLGINCLHTGPIPEILRGIRLHLNAYIQNFTKQSSVVAQLGLGHSYSRAKVKFNVNFVDNMIIQSIALVDQLDKDINMFSMRIREWYSYHFPELYKIVPENYLFAKTVRLVGNRKELTEEKLPELEEVVMDSGKSQAILDAARSSMGMDISPLDLMNIQMFATRVIELADYRAELMDYLRSKMHTIAPNLCSILGEQVGARLISHAGSLTNLAKYPASTVQILGAEKALFRALKTRGKTPKYGIIYNSSYIGKAGLANKGRISRILANKCSLASRIDCFADVPSNIFGEKLRAQIEDRLKYYETGELPPKNIDVMKSALEEYQQLVMTETNAENSAKKKKKKKRKSEAGSEGTPVVAKENVEVISERPKKKKKKSLVNDEIQQEAETVLSFTDAAMEVDGETIVKKKKKKKSLANDENVQDGQNGHHAEMELNTTAEDGVVVGKKKKKKQIR